MKGVFCTIRRNVFCQENSCSECAIYENRNNIDDLTIGGLVKNSKTNYHSHRNTLICSQHSGSIPDGSIPAVYLVAPQDHAEAKLFLDQYDPPTPSRLCNYIHKARDSAPSQPPNIPLTANSSLESLANTGRRVADLQDVAGCGANPQGNSNTLLAQAGRAGVEQSSSAVGSNPTESLYRRQSLVDLHGACTPIFLEVTLYKY